MPIDQAILDIIAREQVGDQHALQAHLSRRGISLTQSALSRRLRKLRVQKRDGRYVKPDPAPAAPAYTLAAVPPNLVVLRTAPGFAQALALAVDRASPPGFAGSVAGDDTVFFAAASPDLLGSLLEAIDRLLQPR
jgi:transcriptional regulator of arginine metabolism